MKNDQTLLVMIAGAAIVLALAGIMTFLGM